MTTKTFAIACLVLLLSACGFHLRGAVKMPEGLGDVQVVATDPYSQLANALSLALTRNGVPATVEVVKPDASGQTRTDSGADTPHATLNIVYERWGDRASAVDEFGRAQEFTLRYATAFTLKRADGTIVVPQQSIELARDYVSVPTDSSGTLGERELLVREMQREMVAAIMRRLETVGNAPDPKSANTISGS